MTDIILLINSRFQFGNWFLSLVSFQTYILKTSTTIFAWWNLQDTTFLLLSFLSFLSGHSYDGEISRFSFIWQQIVLTGKIIILWDNKTMKRQMGLIYTPQDFHKVFHIYKQFRASHKNDGRPQDGIGYNCSAWISIFYHQRMFIISFVTFYSAHPYYNLSLLLPFTKCCWIICTLFFQVPKSSK